MFDLPLPDPAFEYVLASRGISKGLAQTERLQIVPRANLAIGSVQLGGQWKNVDATGATGEAAAFASVARPLGKFQLSASANYKMSTGAEGPIDDEAVEFAGALSRRFGRVGLRAAIVFSPDDLGSTRRSLYFDGGPTIDLGKDTRLSAAIARRSRRGGPDYTAFNAGIARTFYKKLTLDLRYFDTAQSELGDAYRARAVASARLAF